MRILMLLSQTHITGAEVHAVQLGDWLIQNQHQVIIVSDTLTVKTHIPYIARPIHPKGLFKRWGNILFLRRLIQKENIDVVHAHSRAAVRVAYWACWGTRAALVSTVHGRQHFSWSKRLRNIYGRHIIAICENIKQHLVKDFRIFRDFVQVLRNPLQNEKLKFVTKLTAEKKIAVVGRTSGPKGEKTRDLILHVFPEVLKTHPDLKIHLWGGPQLEYLGPEALAKMEELNRQYPQCIEFKGSGALDDILGEYQIIIGAGRVAMAALLRGIPVWALGEAKSEGRVQVDTFKNCLASNFGDIDVTAKSQALSNTEIIQGLKDFLAKELPNETERKTLSELALKEFGISQVGSRILNVYKAALLYKHYPRHFPILMYHLVTKEEVPTKHKIYVTSENFEKQISFYHRLGFQSLVFSDLEDFCEGRRPWSEFPRKPLMITFDDGYQNNLTEALPILKKYGFKAVIYLLANHVDQNNKWDEGEVPLTPLLTPSERQELFRSGVFEVGSHGRYHRPLTSLNLEEAREELIQSKEFLEKEFGGRILSYAFTYGLRTDELADLAQQVGYNYIVNTDQGGFHISTPLTSIFRTPIFPQDQGHKLWRKLQPWYRRYFYWTRKK